MLGSGSSKKTLKQRGGFFPIGAALTAAPAIIDLLVDFFSKIQTRNKRRSSS